MSGWADEPLLDPDQLAGYADLLPPEQLASLVEAYRRELATRPDEVAELIDRGDLVSVRIAAHRLKGASLTIGARRVAMLAGAIEEAEVFSSLIASLKESAAATADALAATVTR